MRTIRVTSLALALSFPLAALAVTCPPTTQPPAPFSLHRYISDKSPQATGQLTIKQDDATQAAIDAAVAPIKSKADLQAYLVAHKHGSSPLDMLSPSARQRFLASLKFNEKGLTSFEYADLRNELTPTQAYLVLSLLGIQRFTSQMGYVPSLTGTDHLIMSQSRYSTGLVKPAIWENHYCFNRGSCAPACDWGCTENC